jgi:hypothetical protein
MTSCDTAVIGRCMSVRALDVEHARTAVNVAGSPVTAERLYATLVALYGGDPHDIDWRDERAPYRPVSSERLRTVLALRTQTDLEEGLSMRSSGTALTGVPWSPSAGTPGRGGDADPAPQPVEREVLVELLPVPGAPGKSSPRSSREMSARASDHSASSLQCTGALQRQ